MLYEATQRSKGVAAYQSQAHILETAGSKGERLRDVFRRNLEAWETLIEKSTKTKGLFRLKI
jgi:hypothetical protein